MLLAHFIFGQLIIESDSLLVIKSLSSYDEEFSKFGYLASNFVSSVDVSLRSFSHVYRTGNCSALLLVKDTLAYDSEQEWPRNILSHIAHSISLDFTT